MFIHMHICTYAKKLKDLLSFIVGVVVILYGNMKMVSLNFLTSTLYWKNMLLFLCSIMFERKLKKSLHMNGKQPTCRSKATSKNWISIWIVWQRRKKDRRVVYCTKAILCKSKCYLFNAFFILPIWFFSFNGFDVTSVEQWKLSWSINGITGSGNVKKLVPIRS